MDTNEVICGLLILSILVRSCSGPATMQDLLNAVLNDEARKTAQKLHKRFFDNLCIHAGSFETECCGFFNVDGTCACNADIDNYLCTYTGAYGHGYGGTVGQKKDMNENIKLGMLY
ncbi:unnamed protein product [Adineta steineri]|uniref:Uncharacterized protein n=1 Tax=Adineta steineri TaxID=433720 RepID=A0A815HLT3_9BILA|nr:unnamed protein product [Adineta steineri]CAF3806108.1 unnamed protein product [Adineta steineri]